MPYSLRQTLNHHSSDVRAVSVINEHKFVSASRDKTSVIWETVDESHFFPIKELKGGEHFINCICVIPPSEKYPQGIIITGTQDNRILVHDPASPIPINVCRGHQNAVSALCTLSENTFASGSWDGTVKIWNIDKPLCIANHTHHKGAVFALLKLTDTLLLSAAADKLINVYKLPEIDILRGIAGHNDCVRGLAALDDNQFLSCSNDGTVRRWQADTGLSVGILHSSDSFIYSISALPDASLIICGCEDNKVVVLEDGHTQELMVPAISVWSVGIFPSRDIIIATSDGILRIFTPRSERQADQAELEEYETLLMIALGNRDSGGAGSSGLDEHNLKNLPGREALTRPGQKDGQILLISEDDKAFCYQWSSAAGTWIMVGDVTGINADVKKPKEKAVFEGKEYDFVFDVDVEEGRPPLKLPFSYGDNPYVVAEAFLLKYNLASSFKMDVVNFILKNVPEIPSVGTGYFQPKETESEKKPTFVYAIDSYILAKNIDMTKAKAKLLEILYKRSVGQSQNVRWIEDLVEMAKNGIIPSEDTQMRIKNSLKWPPDHAFPVLDFLRVAVIYEQPNTKLCSDEETIDFVNMFRAHSDCNTSPINNMLVMRLIANMVIHDSGKLLALRNASVILSQCKGIASRPNKIPALEIALSNCIVNVTIAHIKSNSLSNIEELINAGLFILERIKSKEGMCRVLAGVGSAVLSCNELKALPTSMEFLEKLTWPIEADDLTIKVGRVAHELIKLIKIKFHPD